MTFLLLNQTFHPDVMATGQYLTEVAMRLVERGHQVTVVTSRRAYDHPEMQFSKREMWRGIHIYRVGSTGLGKGAKWRRTADFATFLFSATVRLALLPRHDVVVALTSPPLISFLGAWLARLRRSAFIYWVMDFNPDEAMAAGWLRPDSLAARALEGMSRFSLRRARKVIALDRFMRDRIVAKGIAPEKVAVIPPWSHDGEVRFDAEGRERFRKAHGLEGKFVVMYSGNHSPCHPLDSLLEAARQLAPDSGIVFCFIGGGSEWRRINQQVGDGGWELEHGRREMEGKPRGQQTAGRQEPGRPPQPNILCLPYQPLAQLGGSLSAADLQVVVMGDAFVGLVHPCKIYNVLSVGAPVLYIGPERSHLSEILAAIGDGGLRASVGHGDVNGVVQSINSLRQQSGGASRQVPVYVRSLFSKEALLPKLIAELESA